MRKFLFLILLALLAGGQAMADSHESGFLDDYSKLQPVPGSERVSRYLAPGANEKLAKVAAILIPQPTVIIAKDSKFRGAKPDDLKAVADVFHAVLAQELGKDFVIARTRRRAC